MYSPNPRSGELSRSRLKALATWIRDDLDLLVAREGPDVLRPDDVLLLHETFQALRHQTSISVLDLRATGIHKAVIDISGVATRWPSRLCDDCDKIVGLWRAKFGPLSDLHPFLYGRGGRLEGIASYTEHSRESLLKRWSQVCPEKIDSKQSHRLGDLGFRAGAWWINPLFAYHAGIIGLESVEGGTTFDKLGAYALVLKDTGEVEASSEEKFSYRVPQGDKGKYRLTAATPRSRDPIRVLRSHSINSIWGPKAGIRYEGLYTVKGWSVYQAKEKDAAVGDMKPGDIVFEVHFARADPTPMDEVVKRPTATEVDDYSEFKRLRKLQREGKRIEYTGHPVEIESAAIAKAAPPIPPLQPLLPVAASAKARRGGSPRGSRKGMFKHPRFDQKEPYENPSIDVVSPMTNPEIDHFPLGPPQSNALAVPGQIGSPGGLSSSNSDSHAATEPGSGASSINTAASKRSVIREVAPWVDMEVSLQVPPPPKMVPDSREEIISQALKANVGGRRDPTKNFRLGTYHSAGHSPAPVIPSSELLAPRKERPSTSLKPDSGKRRDLRKALFARNRNPMAKLFEGAKDGVQELDSDDYFKTTLTNEPSTYQSSTPQSQGRSHRICSEGSSINELQTPIPIRTFSPYVTTRRNAIHSDSAIDSSTDHHGLVQPFFPMIPFQDSNIRNITSPSIFSSPSIDPGFNASIDTLPQRSSSSLPISLKTFLAIPLPTSLQSDPFVEASPPPATSRTSSYRKGGVISRPGSETWLDREKKHVQVAFRDPFAGDSGTSEQTEERRRLIERGSSEIAPDAIA